MAIPAGLLLVLLAVAAGATAQVHWVAVGTESLGEQGAFSEDGAVWERLGALDFPSDPMWQAAYGDGVWVAVGSNGAAAHSANGWAWTPASSPPPSGSTLYNVAYGDGRFVAVGLLGASGVVFYSDDGGDTWTQASAPMFSSVQLVGGVAYGDGTWVAVGGTFGSGHTAAHSTDGASWTAASVFPTTGGWPLHVGYSEDQDRFVAITDGSTVRSDDGGDTWTASSLPWSGGFNGWTVNYGGGIWVAAADTGGSVSHVATSPDGSTWTAAGAGLPHTSTVVDAVYGWVGGDPGWLLGATGGRLTFSTDGLQTWTDLTGAFPHAGGIYGLATAGPWPEADPSEVWAEDSEVVAHPSHTTTVHVRLRDADQQPVEVSGLNVTLAVDLGNVEPEATFDDTTGTYTATYTAAAVLGTATVTAYLAGTEIPQKAVIELVPGPPDAQESTLTATPSSLVANGSHTAQLLLELRDAHGHPVGSSAGTVTLTTDNGTLELPDGTGSGTSLAPLDHGDGTYSAVLRSATTLAVATVEARLGGDPIADPAVVPFVAGPPSGSHSTLTVDPDTMVADGEGTAHVNLTVRDAFGNPVGSSVGPVTLSVAGSGTGTVSAATDHGDGTYTALYTAGTRAGAAHVTASFAGQTAEVQVQLLPGPLHAEATTLEAAPATVVLDGASTATVTLGLRDQYGNLVGEGGHDVTVRTSLGDLVAGTENGTEVQPEDQGDGTYTAVLTAPTVAGTALLEATLGGLPLNATASVQFVPGPPSAGTSVLEAHPAAIDADGLDESIVTLTLHDAFGNPIGAGGATVDMQSSLGRLSDVVDHGDGTYTARLTSLDPGTATVVASVAGGTLEATVALQVPAGPLAVLAPVADAACPHVPMALEAVAHHGGVDVAEWNWDFGDGTLQVAAGTGSHRSAVEHAFPGRGTYTIGVEAQFANGSVADAAGEVTVLGCIDPVADFSHTLEGTATVRFTDRSHDPDPLAGIVAWHWDLGDGTTAAGPEPVHTYSSLGHHTVTLTVTDVEGNTGTASRVVTLMQASANSDSGVPGSGVPGTVPVARLAGPAEALAGEVVSLDGSGSSPSWVRHMWSQVSGPDVAWLDRSGAVATFTAPEVDAQTDLRFSLVVRDGAFASEVVYHSLRVAPRAAGPGPAAVAEVVPPGAVEPGTRVVLDGSRSGTGLSWSWVQVGGPRVELEGAAGAVASLTAPEAAAQLTFRLTVGDGRSEDSTEVTVRVEPAALPEAGFTAQAAPDGSNRVAFEPLEPGLRHAWDFGDGSPASRVPAPVHAYPGPGGYEVVHRVWDAEGRVGEERLVVVVPEASSGVGPAVGPGEALDDGGPEGGARVVPGMGMAAVVGVVLGIGALLGRRR